MFDICPFCCFFLLELFDRQGFDNHAYLFDDISWNRKKKVIV